MSFAAGDVVRVRGIRWIVDEATALGDCKMLTLSAADPADEGRCCKLLLPFDRPVRSTATARVRAVSRRRWMHHLHARMSELRTFGRLRMAAGASMDILPFQLEPALALIAGRASRVLLADEVGLGKTIQAGLMVAELRQRGWCERALILTPAGLRSQWAEELRQRFDIRAAVVDAAALAALTSTLPPDVNPWAVEPVFIASIDFVKQPEVLRGLCSQIWDVLIVDEAHQASGASRRYEAVRTLASRSRHVVLLTATPHTGDDAAYRALCELGQLDRADQLLLFRRTRQQAGLPRTRRVHLLPVRLTPSGADMHRLLATYVARLWQVARDTGRRDIQLVAIVLCKRAFSSASSLAVSVERRLNAISGAVPTPRQQDLSFDADEEPSDEAPCPDAPAFDRQDDELEHLRRLLEAARRAQQEDRKMHALQRLLRRVREPAIVFTEYRDTLQAIELRVGHLRPTTALHGGHTPQERRAAIDAFTSGAADLLLATDAGAEGLNLQSRCRLVVNLELPWNPMRLEQRIGRVDRIGQNRTVHAINLLADGTAERSILARLLRRLDRVHASEIEIAARIISQSPLPIRDGDGAIAGRTESADLKAAGRAEAARIRTARAHRLATRRVDEDIIPVTAVKSRSLRSVVLSSLVPGSAVPGSVVHQPGALWFVRIRMVNRAGRLIEDTLVPVFAPLVDPSKLLGGALRHRETRAVAEQMIADSGRTIVEHVSRLAADRASAIGRESAEWVARAVRRERHLSSAAGSAVGGPFQVGLFDSRALTRRRSAAQHWRRIADECAERRTLLEVGAAVVRAHEPQVALLLVSC